MDIKKSNIYTKGGDKGMTSLVSGNRVSKASQRLETYGTADELNSHIGLLRATLPEGTNQEPILEMIQSRLFTAGSYLATDNTVKLDFEIPCGITHKDVRVLEEQIDLMDAALPKLRAFILPAGGVATSVAHICRTITRRTEREIYRLLEVDEKAEVIEEVRLFFNRLSDYFFILARTTARIEGGSEVTWHCEKSE